MAPLPTTKRGQETRQRILAAAAEVVAERGAIEASLDEIGERAHASRSQLYHYFDNKQDLLSAVAEETNDAVLLPQRDVFAGLTSWSGFLRWADEQIEGGEQRNWHGGCPIATLLGQVGERNESVRAVVSRGFDRWEASIRDGLEAMVASGELRADADPAWLAASTLATLQGGILLAQARRDARPMRSALDGALGLIASYRSSG